MIRGLKLRKLLKEANPLANKLEENDIKIKPVLQRYLEEAEVLY